MPSVHSSTDKHRYSSRSNSFSSASVVTIKRNGSLSSSSTGARNSAVPMRAQSPSETSLIALRVGRDPMPQDQKRRKSVAVDLSDRGNSEGLDNLNRWSQSTTSSAASNGVQRRNRASSGAVLPGLPTQSFSPQRKSRATVDYSPRASPHRQGTSSRPTSRRQHRSRPPSTERAEVPLGPLSSLPPLHTTPALTDPNDTESPSTLPTVPTPSTYSSYGQDYFGENGTSPRNNAKSKKPVLIRGHTAPMAPAAATRLSMAEGAQELAGKKRRSEQRQDERQEPIQNGRHQVQTDDNPIPGPARESSGKRRSRNREKSEKDKKTMLSKALQKANTAVLLDNAQNFEGALDAYNDACKLLQMVMDRSSAAEDKRKLDAIRVTYTSRIEELRQLEAAQPELPEEKKSLPARPMSDDSLPLSPIHTSRSPTIAASLANSGNAETMSNHVLDAPQLAPPEKDRDSFLSGTLQAVEDRSRQRDEPPSAIEPSSAATFDPVEPINEPVPTSKSLAEPFRDKRREVSPAPGRNALDVPPLKTTSRHLPPPGDSKYIPAPLSPRRPLSPNNSKADTNDSLQKAAEPMHVEQKPTLDQEDSAAPLAWLDTIEESGSSCASSVHSRDSQLEMRRKHIRGISDGTNPDFDTAFDAAVEAAYDQGLEPDLGGTGSLEQQPQQRTHAPKESINVRSSTIKEILSPTNEFFPTSTLSLDPEDEEEERILDDITQDYAQNFNFDLSSKSALPRQSGSSGYSRSTWQSSQISDRTTAGTSLSTVAEDTLPAVRGSKNAFVASPPSTNTVPESPAGPPPQTSLPSLPNSGANRLSGVRSRRLSGANTKQLKIETSTAKPEPRKRASTFHHSDSALVEDEEPKAALDKDFKFGAALEPSASDLAHEQTLRSPPSLDMRSVGSDSARPLTATTATTTTSDHRQSLDESVGDLATHRYNFFKKNKSSVSLREHTVLITSPTAETGPALLTPMSSTFMSYTTKQRSNEAPLTSQRANLPSFGPTTADSLYSGGVYLFDSSLTAAQSATSPRSPPASQPNGLEPCPESFLLRPFWLMRSIASTLIHPKGGFLTTELFVPREAWMTRGVKLKSVEDKIAGCDLLTAALGRLSSVDTYDADAVMEELQIFEDVMERVQTTLSKKLGNDVGVHGLTGMFKESPSSANLSAAGGQGTDTVSGAEKTKPKESKGYLNSWRKLRSKSSGAPILGSQPNRTANKASQKDMHTMQSVPMTSFVPVERRGNRKDARNLAFEGPNREYMGSLVRLFEGAQILDQIARQVEDPGLRGTSPTHVGLELSIRHAAEFFGFYICRFVLSDLGILVDKFVKRGTEWVLA